MKKILATFAIISLTMMGWSAYVMAASTSITTKLGANTMGAAVNPGSKNTLQTNSKAAGQTNKNINTWCEEDCGKQITPAKKGGTIQK